MRLKQKLWLVILWMAALCLPLGALADPQPASVVDQGGSRSGTVRVYLSSLSDAAQLDLTLAGAYILEGASTEYAGGSRLTVSYAGGSISLTQNGTAKNMGTSFTLRRKENSLSSGVKIAQGRAPSSLYTGDLSFVVRSGRMYPIVHVYIEDYLYGVLPFEMSNSFPLAALKAQAVAARSYTLKAMNQRGALYDVVDTTNDQVYRGLPSGNARCKQAVDETAGMVGLYEGNVMAANYGASNGGQTESVKNAWGSSGYGYLRVQDDPYDLANRESIVKTAAISQNGASPAALETQLKTKLSAKLATLGYRSGMESIQIAEITRITPHTPKFASPSRLYTKIDVAMRVSAVTNAGATQQVPGEIVVTFDYFSELENLLGLNINTNSKNELVEVDRSGTGYTLSARRYGHGIGLSQRGAEQMANQGLSMEQIIGFYYPGVVIGKYHFTRDQLAAGTGDQAPPEEAEQKPVDASQSKARVTLTNPYETLNLRGGAGMYAGILARIPHGTELSVLSSDGTWYKVKYGSLEGYVMGTFLTFGTGGTEAPGPTATPQPGAGTAPVSGVQAQVALSSVQSRLNMRSGPSTTSMVTLRLTHGAKLVVVGRTGTWLKVYYGATEGYVAQAYVELLEQTEIPVLDGAGAPQATTPTPAPAATPDPNATPDPLATPAPTGSDGLVITPAPTAAPATPGSALVNTPRGQTLNLRKTPSTSADVVTRLSSQAVVEVLSTASDWSHVRYGSMEGYVSTSYLTITTQPVNMGGGATPVPSGAGTAPAPAGQSAVVKLRYSTSRLNMRRNPDSTSTVVGTVGHGERLSVYAQTGNWSEVAYGGQRGYVASQYLEMEGAAAVTPVPGMTPIPITSGAPAQKQWEEIIIDVSSSLNLRATPSTNARIISSIPGGTHIAAISEDASWYYVIWNGNTGYVAKQYTKPADVKTLSLPDTVTGAVIPSAPELMPGLTAMPTATLPTATAAPAAATATPATQAEATAQPVPSAAPVTASSVDPSVINQGKVGDAVAKASVYGMADDTAAAFGALDTGSPVQVLGYAGTGAEWCEVLSGTTRGFVKRADLALELPVGLVRLEDVSSTLSLRAGPSVSDAIIAQVRIGGVTVLSKEDPKWVYVQVEGGKKGYLSADYVEVP